MNALQHMTIVALVSLALPGAAQAGRRSIAVLEYRANVSAGRTIAPAMVEQIQRLTSNEVIAGAEALRRYGPALHGAVARCKGEAACVAKIGQRLRSDEVILVGLSQLGDLIVAIQRIDSRSNQVLARLADSLSKRRAIRPRVIELYIRKLLPAEDFRRYGRIIIRSDVIGDVVFVDGQQRGRTPLEAITVPAPGKYALRVTRKGHTDFIARLDVLPDASVEVRPTLTRQNRKRSWYEKWWVWAIVGGVIAAGATTVAIVTRPGPDNVEAVVRWNR